MQQLVAKEPLGSSPIYWSAHLRSKLCEKLISEKHARKSRSYASSKLRLTHWLTGVKCRATSVAKNCDVALYLEFDSDDL